MPHSSTVCNIDATGISLPLRRQRCAFYYSLRTRADLSRYGTTKDISYGRCSLRPPMPLLQLCTSVLISSAKYIDIHSARIDQRYCKTYSPFNSLLFLPFCRVSSTTPKPEPQQNHRDVVASKDLLFSMFYNSNFCPCWVFCQFWRLFNSKSFGRSGLETDVSDTFD